MTRRGFMCLGAMIWLLGNAPLAAQVGKVIYGRVEDAEFRVPVEGVLIFSPDSSTIVTTDSLGTFALPLRLDDPLTIASERFGYISQQFDLGPDALLHMNVLMIEPAPIELEGIDVVTEQAITTLVENLQTRRSAHPSAVRAFDKTWLERYVPGGTAFEAVRHGIPNMVVTADPDDICVPGRGASSFRGGDATSCYLICIDGWISLKRDLENLPVQSISLVEVFKGGPRQIRVYTTLYMLSLARNRNTMAVPLSKDWC